MAGESPTPLEGALAMNPKTAVPIILTFLFLGAFGIAFFARTLYLERKERRNAAMAIDSASEPLMSSRMDTGPDGSSPHTTTTTATRSWDFTEAIPIIDCFEAKMTSPALPVFMPVAPARPAMAQSLTQTDVSFFEPDEVKEPVKKDDFAFLTVQAGDLRHSEPGASAVKTAPAMQLNRTMAGGPLIERERRMTTGNRLTDDRIAVSRLSTQKGVRPEYPRLVKFRYKTVKRKRRVSRIPPPPVVPEEVVEDEEKPVFPVFMMSSDSSHDWERPRRPAKLPKYVPGRLGVPNI
jgi:hypothetical protein